MQVLAPHDRLRLPLQAVPRRETERTLGLPAVRADAGATGGPDLGHDVLEQRTAVAVATLVGKDREPRPPEVQVVALGVEDEGASHGRCRRRSRGSRPAARRPSPAAGTCRSGSRATGAPTARRQRPPRGGSRSRRATSAASSGPKRWISSAAMGPGCRAAEPDASELRNGGDGYRFLPLGTTTEGVPDHFASALACFSARFSLRERAVLLGHGVTRGLVGHGDAPWWSAGGSLLQDPTPVVPVRRPRDAGPAGTRSSGCR